MKNILIPLSGTFRPKGGMTGAVLKKASALAEHGHHVRLVTFRYRMDQQEHESYLISEGLLSPKVEVVNFYEQLDLAQQKAQTGRQNEDLRAQRADLVQPKNENLTRHFNSEGDLLYTELSMHEDHPYTLRRFYDLDLSLLRIEKRDLNGNLRHVRRYMPGGKQPLSESYISRNGYAYLTTWYRQNGTVVCLIDHSRQSGELNPDVGNIDTLQANWFRELVGETPEAVLLIDDPYSFEVARNGMKLASKSVLTLHSNTFVHPDDPTSGINDENRKLLEQMDHFDCVVASTKAQCDDLSAIYPDQKFLAIPQVVTVAGHELSGTERDRNLLIYVGRLEPSKQLLELIEFIQPLFVAFPSLRFEIYGEGSISDELAAKISGLGLDHCVKLMGRTETPLKQLAKANLSVLATKYEGFGLAIAESMAVGTPVVSFDCRYGPSDMIDDGVSGQLVRVQDFEGLVGALIQLQGDQSKVEAMRPHAQRKIEALCGAPDHATAWNAAIAFGKPQ